MPKIKPFLTAQEEFTAEQIKKDCGALLCIKDVMAYFHFSRSTAERYLQDVDSIEVNGKKRYMATDLARKIEKGRCRA